jgi:hypothetical protein
MEVLQQLLCRFVLVFFDDILIYNRSWSKHLQYMLLILAALQQHQLFMKCFKCSLGRSKVAYLGHMTLASDVIMDQQKVQAVLDWPILSSVCTLQSFLGLAGYYHSFIHD